MTLSCQSVKSAALSIGFSDCGIAEAAPLPAGEFPLERWLQRGYHADMGYMQRNTDKRHDPRLLLPGARSIVALLVAYKPDRQIAGAHHIAQYAYGEDYHDRLRRMMYWLIEHLKEQYPGFEARPYVDTAPISDRHWAYRAGLGWIGKNTLLLHPRWGSYCNIGELVTTAAFDHYDKPLDEDPCCQCRRCVDACPNQALQPLDAAQRRYLLDARRCIAYNTIENREPDLPDDLDTRGYAFGCDICQAACPHNAAVAPSLHLDAQRKAQLEALPEADEATFYETTRHTPMSRISYEQWQRNLRH